MTASSEQTFKRDYETHLKHLRLKGLQPKTIEAYARAIRRIGAYFDHRIEDLSEQQLTDYFTDLLESHSWSTVKLDLYGLKFFYAHVRRKPWANIDLVKPPKARRLPDIVTVEEAERLFAATRTLSYSGERGRRKGRKREKGVRALTMCYPRSKIRKGTSFDAAQATVLRC